MPGPDVKCFCCQDGKECACGGGECCITGKCCKEGDGTCCGKCSNAACKCADGCKCEGGCACTMGNYTTPPNVTCSDVTTHPLFVNSFFGLSEGVSYTYEDANRDPSGISYNVTTGTSGDLYPPGRTPVTLIAVDLDGNTATCLFYVENTLTELPVECPDINGTVATNHIGLNKYSFNVTIGPENVTKSIPQYRYHGGDVSVALGVRASPIGSVDDLGTYQLTIADDVLKKTCEGPIRILGRFRRIQVRGLYHALTPVE
nr:uncharacterized protein LOC129267819 [Lytechinus pictus]